ncbi:MAG TPA: hypothetical protein VKA23_01005 [Mariprofundaceae bacterium]|nr:hypothetical protein [Mariprofundaceae bacterium]
MNRRVGLAQKISRRESLFWKMLLLVVIALLALLLTTVQGWMFPLD